ncbi:putative bacteriocin export ABC transporter [Eubacterium sp. MSJ-13]|uniref:putative bacteriocin export ABC transporter n=1 Tax=Eubacterium sp. MSJ-13 TaxID=2841513 RepID=UPI001C1168F5|nr:putative bacteriocin export ABC transporter [Eubacterium sp. MSJ-13]MBU5477979.1 putative bacteriocin export ABC transporter [Eubacterium sp. MSJ-13]
MVESVYSINSVNKSYGEKSIIKNLNLEIHQNEIFCISGASGSGKSTLLNMLGMLDKPDSGKILFFGEQLPEINSKRARMLLRNKLFYVFQNFALIDDYTISENLDIPMNGMKLSRDERKRIKIEALRKVELECNISKKIYTLSGGEQQRVAIARGFLRKFDVLLADEPTGSLDPVNRDIIMDIFEEFKKMGKTIIIVTHDEKVMSRCDRVFKLC